VTPRGSGQGGDLGQMLINPQMDTQLNTPVYPVIVGANCIRPPQIQVVFPIYSADYYHHLKYRCIRISI
jgi:hypothetical protein